MTGAIPPYGGDFTRQRAGSWCRGYSNTLYCWKGNTEYYLRSDDTSKRWWIFRRDEIIRDASCDVQLSEQPYSSLTKAMNGFREAAKALRLTDERTKKS
jgi:hypothetical protein